MDKSLYEKCVAYIEVQYREDVKNLPWLFHIVAILENENLCLKCMNIKLTKHRKWYKYYLQ